jgi:hypothetical protein
MAATEGRVEERRKPRKQRLERAAMSGKDPGRHDEEPVLLLLLVMPLLLLAMSISMKNWVRLGRHGRGS